MIMSWKRRKFERNSRSGQNLKLSELLTQPPANELVLYFLAAYAKLCYI